MDDKYKSHLKERFKNIKKLQQTFGDEKKIGAKFYRDYIESLAHFPQWLTIFTGVISIFGVLTQEFLISAFVCFLLASLIILYIKRSAAQKSNAYLKRLDSVLEETSNFADIMASFAMGKITEDEMKEKEKHFEIDLNKKGKGIYLEENRGEGILIEISFWLSALGGVLLVLSIIL